MDEITVAIRKLTARTIGYRFYLEGERKTRMALELKGIRAKAIMAAQNIDRLNNAYDAFNTAAPAHAADVEGLAPQIESLAEDLTFAAQVLGNSVNGSNAGATQDSQSKPLVNQTVPPAVQMPEPPKIAPAVNSEHLAISPETHTRDSNGTVILK